MDSIFKNKLLYISFFALIIFEIFIFSNIFSNSFIYVDDVDIGVCDSFKNIFKNPANGIVIASFLDRFFAILMPQFLNIHPSAFKSQIFCYIESFLIIGFISILSSFFYTKKKLDWTYITSFLCCSSLLFFIIKQQPNVLYVYDGFFRMLLPTLMFVGLFRLLLDFKENPTKKSLTLISILTFLISISNETLCVTTVIGFILFFLFQIKNKKIYPIILLICSFFGFLVLIKTGAFVRKSGGIIPNIYTYFIDIVPFVNDYVKYIFGKHIIELLLIVFQMVFLFIKKPKEESITNTCILIFCFLFGILSFFFSLILLGRTHYENGQFWLIHADLHMIYSFMLCSFNFALLRLITNYKLISTWTITYIFLTITLFFAISNINYYKAFFKNWLLPMRTEYYKAEKIIRFSSINKKVALLCKDIPYKGDFWPFYINDNVVQEENVEYESSLFIKFINQFEKEKITVKYMFTDKETAEKSFKENGGTFTKEELENIDFNKLRNNKFIFDEN